MSVDSFVQVVEAIAKLLGALAWPSAFVIVALWFAPQVREILGREKVSLTGPAGVGLIAERLPADQRQKVADDLAVAERKPGSTGESTDVVRRTVEAAAEDPRFGRMAGAQVLWVDDHPENNESEQRALERVGIRVDHAFTTNQALSILGHTAYDLIISDLGRSVPGSEEDEDAGLTLIKSMKDRDFRTPVIIYAGPRALARRDELLEAGASEVTNGPTALFTLVSDALLAR
ncbi:MAG: response regulator [Actinomycetia bacterium]|nr:response regulator [Actinomycetes bacterium]